MPSRTCHLLRSRMPGAILRSCLVEANLARPMQPFQSMRVRMVVVTIARFFLMIVCVPAEPHDCPNQMNKDCFPHILERRSMMFVRAMIFGLACLSPVAILMQPARAITRAELDALVAAQAAANGLPVALVHRVIIRESRYNPGIIGKGGAMGLMQIKTATARGVGYSGSAAGLLDPQTNLTYAVRYLAGAYRLAGGNHDRAVSYYARGYYYAAKGKGQTVEA